MMEKTAESNYKFSPVTDKQIKAMGVQALANRPNASGQYGQSGLSPEGLKLWFDKLATLLAEKVRELQTAINGEDAAKYIGLAVGKYKSLDELLEGMQNGAFADEILKVFPRSDVFEAQSLQSVIFGIAKTISELEENKLDKKMPGVKSAYTVGADDSNGTMEISNTPKPLTIPIYDENGEMLVNTPTREGSALNLGYFATYMNNMAEHIGAGVRFSLDPESYIVKIEVLNIEGTVIYTTYLDLPLEQMIVGVRYEDGDIVITLKNGESTRIPVATMIGGLASDEELNREIGKVNARLDALFEEYIDDINEFVGGDYADYS